MYTSLINPTNNPTMDLTKDHLPQNTTDPEAYLLVRVKKVKDDDIYTLFTNKDIEDEELQVMSIYQHKE